MPVIKRRSQGALGAQGLHVVSRTAETLERVVQHEEAEAEAGDRGAPPPRYTDEQRARARERIERDATLGLHDYGEWRNDGRAELSYVGVFRAIREGRLPEVKK